MAGGGPALWAGAALFRDGAAGAAASDAAAVRPVSFPDAGAWASAGGLCRAAGLPDAVRACVCRV